MKRILLVIGIIIAAAGVVVAGMLLRGGDEPVGPGTGGLPPGGGTLPIGTGAAGSGPSNGGLQGGIPGDNGAGLAAAGIQQVSQSSDVVDYAVNPEMGLLLLDSGGAIILSSSSEAIVARANFGDIMEGYFSADGRWLLVRTGIPGSTRWSLLDINQGNWKDISANTSAMLWSPKGDRLAYFAERTGGAALTIYNPATNSSRALVTLSAPDLTLRWADSENILIMDHPSSLVPGNIWKISVADGSMALFARDVSGADVIWGGPESGGLLFRAGPTGGTMAMVDSAGTIGRISTFLTLPSKCVFGESSPSITSTSTLASYLFCAVPQDNNLLRNRQLPDSYLKKEFATSDALYAIDLYNGAVLTILPASQTFSFDASNMKVYGQDLYFTDRHSRKLYRVPLGTITEEPLTEE